MWLFEMCVLLLSLWQLSLTSVAALWSWAAGLLLPAEGTEIHPTLWLLDREPPSWGLGSAFLNLSPTPANGNQHTLVTLCSLAKRRLSGVHVALRSRPYLFCVLPARGPARILRAAAHGSKCLAEVPLQNHSEGRLRNWMELDWRVLCGPFFRL